jgi:hypothetical protein
MEPVFSKLDLLWWKVLASLSLFLKSEQIPALLYVGKGPEYKPFRDFQRVPSDTDLKSGRACTQALLLYIMPCVWREEPCLWDGILLPKIGDTSLYTEIIKECFTKMKSLFFPLGGCFIIHNAGSLIVLFLP